MINKEIQNKKNGKEYCLETKFKYRIACGSRTGMEMIMERGYRALNPRTRRYQMVDKEAKYKLVVDAIITNTDTGTKEECCSLLCDRDLEKIANDKKLIF